MKTRCNKQISEQNGFCAPKPGHTDLCDKMLRITRQGVRIPIKRKLVRAVPAHYVKVPQLDDISVVCLGWTVDSPNGCGATLRVADLTYIQTHWYTAPYSCSGGDYWNQGEGQFMCPKCGEKNRLYERPEVEKLKSRFKDVKDTYRD